MIDRLQQMEQRYDELSAQLGLPEVITDHEKYQKAGRALREIEPAVMKFRELKQVRQGLAEARAMLAESDAEMHAMLRRKLPRWRHESRCSRKRSRCCCCPRTRMTRRT